jgi:cytochrome b6-f complex iron-sulfur subunit
MTASTPDIQQPYKKGRRDFLHRSWLLLGLVAAAEFLFFIVNLLRPGKEQRSTASSTLKVIGNVEDFPVNSVTTDRINKLFLVRQKDGGFLALSLICSHLGCSVNWDEPNDRFICPCHSSVFDKSGNVINSPAPRALDYFPVAIEAGKVRIDMDKKMKRKKFDKSQVTYAQ